MDKTFNNLMDIVSRTKKIDEKEGRISKPKREEIKPNLSESNKELKPAKTSLFEGKDAINKYLSASKQKKETAKTASKTTAKSTKKTSTKKTTKSGTKSTKKSTTKKTTTKKPAVKDVEEIKAKSTASIETKKEKAKDIADKFQLINKKTIVKPKKPELDMNDPKNVELYNALKETLLAGGTDVSEYMGDGGVSAKKLNELFAQKKARTVTDEITREQQEYEKLFTGSFAGEESKENVDGEMSENGLQEYFAKQNEENKTEDNKSDTAENKDGENSTEKFDDGAETIADNNENIRRNRFDVDLDEFNNRDRELDEKIADYYKRKQEKLNAYTQSQMEENSEDNKEQKDDREIERDYENIFNGEVEKRSAVLGEEEPEEEVIEEPAPTTKSEDDFQTLYHSLSADNFDEYTDKFVTPASELPHGESYVEPKDIEESEDKEETVEKADEKEPENIDTRTAKEIELDNYTESADDEDDDTYDQSNDDIYDLSSEDSDLDDYIVSSNIPIETSGNDDEDNTMVISSHDLPENKVDYYDSIDEDKGERVVDGDAISKQEFYNEMARLQENLINELKNGTAKSDEVKEPESTSNSTLDKALDIIGQLTSAKASVQQPSVVDAKAEKVADDLINTIGKEMKLENLIDGEENENNSVESEDQENEDKDYNQIFADIKPDENVVVSPLPEGEKLDPAFGVPAIDGNVSLLNKDVALNDSDLQYIVESEKAKNDKTEYFYMSEEDKEKKKIDESYIQKTDTPTGKEMGDINLNKDIANAVSTTEENAKTDTTPKPNDMELIYTIFGVQKKKVEKMENEIKVLYVTSECLPFAATGGLADVAGSLPKAINKIGGVDVRVIMPLYGKIKNEYGDKLEYIGNFTVHLSWRQEYCGLFKYTTDGVTYYFVDNERYFKRSSMYGFYDDGERFAYFCKAIVEGLPMLNFFPDIIHCNDWQSALVSTYIKTGNWSDFRYYKIKNLYTIHNVEYQGVYGMENLKDLFGIDNRFKNDLEYNGDINLTKAAIQFSDKFTTVSNSYCDNLKQPYCSRGLHHIIIRNEYKLSGIINGIDEDFYNPKTDSVIYKNYDIDSIDDKVYNKKILQDELGLPVDAKTPLIAMATRLVSHKGLDLVTKILEEVLAKDVQFVIVGTGEQRFIDYFKYLENKYPTKVRALVDKYSNENARKLYAASDIFLMPSKIEPCGISQMIASRYGSIPIVREVGGLKDTITDFGCVGGGNGYTFANYNPNDLLSQINRALEDYRDEPEWKKKMRIVMSKDFSWSNSARKYIDLYKALVD